LGNPVGGEFGAAQLDMKNEALARTGSPADDQVGKLLADMTLARLKRRAAARDAKPDFADHPQAGDDACHRSRCADHARGCFRRAFAAGSG
jgi:hypothetical protein